MGLIENVRKKIPLTNNTEPESDIKLKDFETDTNNEKESEENSESDSTNSEDNNNSESDSTNSEDNNNSESDSSNADKNDQEESDSTKSENDNREKPDSKESAEDNNSNNNSPDNSKENQENSDNDNLEDDIEGMIDEMIDSSKEKESKNWDGKGNTEIPEFIKNSFEKFKDEASSPETDIDKKIEERDNRIGRAKVSSESALEKYNEKLSNDVAEAFRRIKTQDRPQPSTHGQKVNVRGVIRRIQGDHTEDRLYLQGKPAESGNRCITLVNDSSGSIDELKLKMAIISLAESCEIIGDNFAAIHYCTKSTYSYEGSTYLITAPTEEFEPEHLDSFKAKGYTPTAEGIKYGRNISETDINREDVIIVLTDGKANITLDNDKNKARALEDASDQIDTARAENKRVIGLGVGNNLSKKYMEKMFGDSYFLADMDNITDTLLKIYESQLDTAEDKKARI